MDLVANCSDDEPLFYYEARALAHTSPSPYCIISPNQRTIRAPPCADGYTTKLVVLQLYPDYSYGPHEYSTEPQFWDPSRPHLPWIPRSPAALEGVNGLEVLWRPLATSDYVRLRPEADYYRISDALARQLQEALVPVQVLAESISRNHSPEVDAIWNACDLARHSVLHMRHAAGLELPDLAHLLRGSKRQILECLGYVLHRGYSRRAPVLDPVHEDIARPPRDVVGLFTFDLEVTRRHVRMRIPVWRIAKVASIPPRIKIVARVEVTPKLYPFGDKKVIAYVYDGEPYIAKLLVANPSQGLYLPLGDTGVYRFCGSVNTVGEIISSADRNSEMAVAGPASSAGGPTRTHSGIRAAREAASALPKSGGAHKAPLDRESALLQAFIVDPEGLVRPAPKRTAEFHNYEARVRLMMEQHGHWGKRVPHGLRAMPAPWSEALQTSKLLLPEAFTEIMLFGPHVSHINRAGAAHRHLMHGYMILRDAIHTAVAQAPIMMKADLWVRLLDHRGWKSLWGELRDRDAKDRAHVEQIRALFMRFVKKPSGELPQPWAEVQYNGRIYRPIQEIEEEPAIAQSTQVAQRDSKRTRRSKKKAQKLLDAQNIPGPAPKMRQRLDDVPDADWDFLLWEMIEMNHHGEVRALERMLHGGEVLERDNDDIIKMLGRDHVKAAARFAERSDASAPRFQGLSGRNPERRWVATALLLKRMSLWKIDGVPYFTYHPQLKGYWDAIRAGLSPGEDGRDSMEIQEVVIIHQWARMFVEKFGRAPTAPRLCPTLEKS